MKIENIKTIITHNGGAHLDDFLSCCVLIARFSSITKIKRLPSGSELFQKDKNPEEVWVDVGGKYNKDLLQFDHHQLKQTIADTTEKGWYKPNNVVSAFQEILLYLYPSIGYDVMVDILPQFRHIAVSDNFGPKAALTDAFNVKNTSVELPQNLPIGELRSLLEISLLSIFASKDDHNKYDALWAVMEMIGKQIDVQISRYIEFEQKLTSSFQFFDNGKVAITELRGDEIIYHALYKFFRELSLMPVCIVAKSAQSNTYAVTRTAAYEKDYDLNDIKEKYKDKLSFVHNSGFLAVFNTTVNKSEVLKITSDFINNYNKQQN